MPEQRMKVLPLQYKIMLLTMGMVCLVLTMAGAILIRNIYNQIEEDIGKDALTIGRIVAGVPTVKEAILSERPSEVLQPITENWRESTGAAFIIISNMEEIRLTHPLAQKVGTHLTDLYRAPVLHGKEYVYIAQGSLAPSLRANVPIYDNNGKQIGFVSVGFYLDDIYAQIVESIRNILYALALALSLSIIGSILVARNVKKAIYGLEPYEIAILLRENEATLDSIREGVVAVDSRGQIRFMNNGAKVIMGQDTEDTYGQPIDRFLKQLKIEEVIKSGQAIYDTEQRVKDIIVLANVVPIIVEGSTTGAVITFRDRTEISRLAEEMTGVHRFIDIMRAQTHEFKNKMHAVAGMIQLGAYDKAVDLIIDSYANNQDGFETLRVNIHDEVIFGLLVGKMSRAKELGVDFVIEKGTAMTGLPGQLSSGDMVIILGNLIENAFEAVATDPLRKVEVSIFETDGELIISVKNTGGWIAEELGKRIYLRGVSSKGEDRGYGLALVSEKVQINNGSIVYYNLPEGGVEFQVIFSQDEKGDDYEKN